MEQTLSMVHNAFYVKNTREENLSSLYGLPQSSDMDMYDFEFHENGEIKAVHKKIYPKD